MRDRAFIGLLGGQILTMLGISSYAVLLPQLKDAWAMSNAEAGIVSSGFFLGYICTVSFWSSLTDRIDARRIYALGCAFASGGLILFGAAAGSFAAGIAAHMLYGIGVSATYMPGLKILSERSEGTAQTRKVSFYTAFFGLGSALSLASTQWLAEVTHWRWAFVLIGLAPLAAWVLVLASTRPLPSAVGAVRPGRLRWGDAFPLAAWLDVLRAAEPRHYVVGYALHCLELFGSRAWVVAFLAWAGGLGIAAGAGGDSGRLPVGPGTIAAFASLLSVFASILGNEAALRLGRARWIRVGMLGSGLLGVLLAASAAQHWTLLAVLTLVYSLAVMADSATLTAGLVLSVPAARRGAALGLYSLLGFGGGMLGPAVFGVALDLSGHGRSIESWIAGFAALGAGCFLFGLRRGPRG